MANQLMILMTNNSKNNDHDTVMILTIDRQHRIMTMLIPSPVLNTPIVWSQICGFIPYIHHSEWDVYGGSASGWWKPSAPSGLSWQAGTCWWAIYWHPIFSQNHLDPFWIHFRHPVLGKPWSVLWFATETVFFNVNHPKKNCNKSHGFFWASPFARGCPTRLRPLPRHRVLPAPERSAGAARHAAHSHQERGGAAGAVAARCAVAESPAVGHGGSMLFVEGLVLVRWLGMIGHGILWGYPQKNRCFMGWDVFFFRISKAFIHIWFHS